MMLLINSTSCEPSSESVQFEMQSVHSLSPPGGTKQKRKVLQRIFTVSLEKFLFELIRGDFRVL